MNRPRQNRITGFTLMELLVVMGIAVVLMAITLPAVKSINESNRMTRCTTKLQQIGQALKIYQLDYAGVPPRLLGFGDDPSNPTTEPVGPGLVALWRTDYMRDIKTLHCPGDLLHQDASQDEFYWSYTGRDERAKTDAAEPYGPFNQYKYLSFRGIMDNTDPDYKRQLNGLEPGWHPDDTTVVIWCDWHADSVIRQGYGQYLVLFWDGSVRMMPEWLFNPDVDPPENVDPSDVPSAAWRVKPSLPEE